MGLSIFLFRLLSLFIIGSDSSGCRHYASNQCLITVKQKIKTIYGIAFADNFGDFCRGAHDSTSVEYYTKCNNNYYEAKNCYACFHSKSTTSEVFVEVKASRYRNKYIGSYGQEDQHNCKNEHNFFAPLRSVL